MKNQIASETATNNGRGNAPRITKESLQSMSDAELLTLIEKSLGHTGKEFEHFMNADFSYSYLTSTLKKRGYENGWHKVSEGVKPTQSAETIVLTRPAPDQTTRRHYTINTDVADKWKQFTDGLPYPSMILDTALSRFMDDVMSGRVRFDLGFGSKN